MTALPHDLIFFSAPRTPIARPLAYSDISLSYGTLAERVTQVARAILELGLARRDRVAVYLEKRPKTVIAAFGAVAAGGVFVLVNPLLKHEQDAHIPWDCNVRILVTSSERLKLLAQMLSECRDLRAIIVLGDQKEPIDGVEVVMWKDALPGILGASE